METKEFYLASRPAGMPDASNFRMDEVELPKLKSGEVLLKALYISVDPYMRGRMNDKESYIKPFKIDEPIEGGVVAEVVDSMSSILDRGDKVTGMLPWATFIVSKDNNVHKIEEMTGIPLSYYLGILGLTGLTAYFGVMKICNPKAGETLVVSGAAGAVGMVVGQIAKILGCSVIGIVGSDDKAKILIDKYGFDKVINYKTATDMKQAVKEACPHGVDCYFDNVGGDISDAVIGNINFDARIAICGQIAMYNDDKLAFGVRILPDILVHSALIQGFIVNKYQKEFPEALKQLTEWLKEGRLHTTETVVEGFEKLPDAFLGLFKGVNIGKMIVKV